MAPYAVLIPALRWLTLAGMLFTSLRLLRAGLYRRYRALSVFLIFSVLRSTALMSLDVRGDPYMKIWVLSEPVRWILCIFLVLEICSLILKEHRGIYTAGQWALSGAFAIAVLSSALTFLPGSDGAFDTSRVLGFLLLADRGLMFSLVVFLVLMLWFLSRYPIVLSRNLLVHVVLYSTYFISTSLAVLVRSTLGKEFSQPTNALLMAATAACALGWGFLLTPAGEKVTRKFRPAWAAGDDRRLIEQLDSLNATLLRISRK
jgi:hypothetical protein